MLSRSILSALVLSLLFSDTIPARADASVAEAADAAEALSVSNEEARANAEQEAFEENFELDPDGNVGKEPDFHALLRKGYKKRIKGKKESTIVVPNVTYGVLFTGPSTYHEGESTPIPPASTNKIFTSALVLKELGGDYVYDTRLTWVKSPDAVAPGDAAYLTFVGAGDPSLTKEDLPKVAADYAAALAAAGVKKVYGALRFSATDPRWNKRAVPDGWMAHDLRTATGFIPNALGTLAEARVKAAVAAALAKKSIKWTSSVSAPFAESAGVPAFASHLSKPMRELIQPFVLHSINYKGEAFLRKIGELKGSRAAEDLNAAGLPILREFVAGMLGPRGGSADVLLNDGSGLSRKSRVTARAMVNFLEAVKGEPYFADFLAALPVAGKSGTLTRRMKGTNAAGRIHAKTGTLDGNYQLAGYLEEMTKDGSEYHPFAVLTDTEDASGGYCHTVQDNALARLADWMLKK